MGESATGTDGPSGPNNNARRFSDGTNKSGKRGGRYVPPHQKHGKNNHDDKRDAASEGASNSSKTRPQKGWGNPRNNSNNKSYNNNNNNNNNNNSNNNSSSNNNINNNNNNNNNNNTRHRGGQRLRLYSSNEDDTIHSNNNNNTVSSFQQMQKECKALRYKVHKPRCNCPKILRMVEHHDSSDELTAVMLEDGRIDALVVVPDTKQKYAYVCRDTPLGVFEDDPRRAEMKLRNELFSKMVTPETVDADVEWNVDALSAIDETKFKLSCASCLLQAHEPNGFCLIASASASVVDEVRDKSLSNRHTKEATGRPLHADHAHFVARLPRSALWNLHRSKTRSQKGGAIDAILGHLSSQDIGTTFHDPEKFTNGIQLGHHLLSVLALTGPLNSNDFWFVMGFDDGKSLELDLPGGKRHLGETSLEGAIRETEEETSLTWDSSWVTHTLQGKKRSDGGNRYFVLHPPQ